MVLVRSVYSLQYFTGLRDITTMSWIISLNDSHVLFNLIVSRENHATTIIVSLRTVMTLCQSLLAVKFSAIRATRWLLWHSDCTKFNFGPRWGSLRRSPDPLVGWGRGYHLPIPQPLDALGISLSMPLASRLGAGVEARYRDPQLLKCCCAPGAGTVKYRPWRSVALQIIQIEIASLVNFEIL